MHITTIATERRKKAVEEQNKCIDDDSSECASMVDDETWFRALIAPNPSRFRGRRGRGVRPTLYGEPEGLDENGKKRHWDVLWGADAEKAIDAHLTSGKRQEPIAIEGFDAYRIRAVSLGYEETDIVGFFSLDLDGKYNAKKVLRALVTAFGKRCILPHSGSGAEDRFRVLGLLRNPMEIRRLKALLGAICKLYGFPPLSGALEIYPSHMHTRMPFGAGGCQMFDPETLRPVGRQDQAACLRAFRALVPIDLDLVAKELGIDPSGIDTGIPIFRRYAVDPYTRVERLRPTPRPVRRRIALGIQGPGERQALTWTFVYDCLLSGKSLERAIELFSEYVEAGMMDKSRDISRYGRDWFLKQIPRTVRRIYATARPVGMPDPIALSERELALIDELVERVSCTRHTSPRRARRMLRMVLPHFKGNLAAGLPLLRWHSDLWRAAGGTHYSRMRDAIGIFVQRTKYKSLSLVRSRQHLGARDEEAYAISWSTSFDFDRDLPSPTYDIARSIGWEPREEDPKVSIVYTIPSIDRSVDSSLPSSSGPTRTPRLYVYCNRISGKSKGSDRPFSSSEPDDQGIRSTQPANPDPSSAPDATFRSRRRPKKRPSTVASPIDAPEKPKPKEWQRIAKWALPGAEGMDLDEWLTRDAEVKREYARELSRAKRKRDLHNRSTTMIRWVSAGECASERFHELRKLFGLNPWN
jgi:hypothetical protein